MTPTEAAREISRRKQKLAADWRELQADVARWNQAHPEEQFRLEPVTAEEIARAIGETK